MRRGRRLTVGGLRLVYRPNGRTYARLGLAVSRKYGGAVRRNRLKRRIRECFRLHAIREVGVDVLVMPVSDWRGTEDVAGDMQRGLERIVGELRGRRT